MAHRLSRRQILGVGLTAAGAAAATPFLTRAASAGTAAPLAPGAVQATLTKAIPTLPWAAANDIVAATKLPMFPDATFDVTKYGAKGDGTTDDTAAFAKAITACNAAGGGHVVVPSGTYLTGAIYLKSNVDLHLNSGATLKFSGTASRYPTVLTRYEAIECMNRSPMIYAYGETNIALTGSGTLDAAATKSWNTGSDRAYLESLIAKGVTDPHKRVVPGSGHHLRSTFVEPYNCDTVLIQGVTLRNSQFWQIHPTLCRNVTVDGVTTRASFKNTDGCDPECSDHVLIVNSDLGGNDDNIAIKSGRDADGRRVNTPSQNIVIVNNTMKGPWGAVTCGSEQTGGIRNVYAYKCVATGTRYALFIKSNTRRGGFTQNINLDSFVGHGQQLAFAFAQMNYMGQTGNFPPQFGNWNITNCTADHTPYAFKMTGLGSDHIKGLTVRDCTFTNIGNADLLSNVDGVSFTNVTLNGKPDNH
ncbi:MAG: endopolygalacturonase [Actinobacteria bacterium 13_2_20CM_2_71_6]|nr:MAG: endopolygalacturonase [Actinobacteria bacterium 13_2_20CM_2_71_6]